MFDSAVVNAFILNSNYMAVTDSGVRQIKIKNFRLCLADGLVGTYNSRQHYARPQALKGAGVSSVSPATKRARADTGFSDGEGMKGPRGGASFVGISGNTAGMIHTFVVESAGRCYAW